MLEAGLHHTATMHSLNMERLNRMARKMKTSIFVKNGPSYAGLGFSGEGTTTLQLLHLLGNLLHRLVALHDVVDVA